MDVTGTGPSGEISDTPRHRALGSASRVGILHLLRRSGEPLTARHVAAATGLHLNTAREHLDRLTDAGLLRRDRAADGTPGRPAWRYSPVPAEPDGGEPAAGPYRQMATALVEHLIRTEPNPAAVAAEVGAAWGRDMAAAARARTGGRGRAAGPPAGTVMEILDGLGFAPRPLPAEPGVVHLHACPFLDLARRHPEVVCGVHLGVVQGALDELGGDSTRAGLEPFGAATACVLRLPVAA